MKLLYNAAMKNYLHTKAQPKLVQTELAYNSSTRFGVSFKIYYDVPNSAIRIMPNERT